MVAVDLMKAATNNLSPLDHLVVAVMVTTKNKQVPQAAVSVASLLLQLHKLMLLLSLAVVAGAIMKWAAVVAEAVKLAAMALVVVLA